MELMTEEKKGFKRTDIGLIPHEWKIKPLSSVTRLMTNGFVGRAKDHYTDTSDGVLYVQGYNVRENSIRYKGIKKVTSSFHNQHKSTELKEGDLLTVQTGDVGLTTIVPKELEGANCHALIITRFGKEVEPMYASYYINSNIGRGRLKELETGTTVKHINVGALKHWLIPLPPTLSEQQAIVSALSDVDELIRSLDGLIQKKQAIKKGIMQQLLTGKKRLPGFDGEWEVKTLGDFADIQRGASPRPISDPKWFSEKKDVGWVRISDIKGKYLYKTRDYLSNEGMKRSRFLEKGSLIMSIAATVGLPVITRMDLCIHDGFVGFWNLRDVDQEYLYYKLKFYRSELEEEGQTGSQSNINSEIVRNFEKSFPSLEEQKAIAQTLSDMDRELQTLRNKREKYVQIKQGMVQVLLTGRVRLV